jgi:hypothetical protein
MLPPYLGTSSRHYHVSTPSAQRPEATGSQAQHSHLATLSRAQLSFNTHTALNRVAVQADPNHRRVALLVSDALRDYAFQLQPGSHLQQATYQASVNSRAHTNPMGIANLITTDLTSIALTLQTRLNDQFQYDIVKADLHDPSGVISVDLSTPASAPGQAPSGSTGQHSSMSSYQDAQTSRNQLTRAQIGQNRTLNLPVRLQAGAPGNNPSIGISNDGSASASGSVPGPSRTPLHQAAGGEPYPAPLQTGAPSSNRKSKLVDDPLHPGRRITQSSLSKRRLVENPKKPGEFISLSKRSRQKQQVPDIKNPGQTISKDTADKRALVPDDRIPGGWISRNAAIKRRSRAAQKAAKMAGPENT